MVAKKMSSFPCAGKPLVYTSAPAALGQAETRGWLYRYYDSHGRLLYIGVTTQQDGGHRRWIYHWGARDNEGGGWAYAVARIFTLPIIGQDPTEAERAAIKAERPAANLALYAGYHGEDFFEQKTRTDLRGFLGAAYRNGVLWWPYWPASAPSVRIEDPWIPATIASEIDAPAAPCSMAVARFSEALYLGGLTEPGYGEAVGLCA